MPRLDAPRSRRQPSSPRRSPSGRRSGCAATRSRSGARYGVGSGNTAATRIARGSTLDLRVQPAPVSSGIQAAAHCALRDRRARRARRIARMRRQQRIEPGCLAQQGGARDLSPVARAAPAHGRPRREQASTCEPACGKVSSKRAHERRRTPKPRPRAAPPRAEGSAPTRHASSARSAPSSGATRSISRSATLLLERPLQPARACDAWPGMHAVEHERLGQVVALGVRRAAASTGRSPRSRDTRRRSAARAARAARGRRARSGGRTAS